MDNQQPSRRKKILHLSLALALMALTPIMILMGIQRLDLIDVITLAEILTQITSQKMLFNIIVTIVEVSITLVVVIVSIALLFRIVIPQRARESIENKWYWTLFLRRLIIGERRVWHILVGYFITVLMLTPTAAIGVTDYIIRPDMEQGIKYDDPGYVAYITAIPMLTIIIISTRILSKLKLQLIDTNIGVFVIAVLVAELIFSVSFGKTPLNQIVALFDEVDYNVRGAFIIYELTAINAVIASIVDWYIITKRMKREL